MCKDDRDWSSPISIKGKSSWEDNPDIVSDELSKEEPDSEEEEAKRCLLVLSCVT